MKRFALIVGCLLVTPWIARAGQADAQGIDFFEKKIRPVLVEHCYQCHSAEAEKVKKLRGGLRLDTRDGLRQGGESGPAIVPGKIKEGHFLQALKYQGDVKMPPKGKLSGEVIADFAKWIEMGAPDPRDGNAVSTKVPKLEEGRTYWAFQPLKVGPPPQVKNQGWGKTPVDAYILQRLQEKKLSPNAVVSREKLIRRAYYDLWGLPPTPADVEAFVKDSSPEAYGKVIDRLLQGEHYGERWARHWLDIVRFAESGGYEFDKDRPGAFHYRDFVIKAFNQDMPYDQFVRWQLAGDQIEKDNFLAASATGFLVAGPFPGQVTSKTLALIRYNHLDDMVSTLGSALLGLSVGCARCHDHKYDPIPTQDYYRLVACLGRTDSVEARLDPEPEKYRQARAAFDKENGPVLTTRDNFEKDELPGRLQKWLKVAKEQGTGPWLLPEFKVAPKASGVVAGKDGAIHLLTLVGQTHLKDITAIRVETEGKLKTLSLMVKPLDGKAAKPTPVKLHSVPVPDKKRFQLFETEGNNGVEGTNEITLTFEFQDAKPGIEPMVAISFAQRPVNPEGNAVPQKFSEFRILLDREKGQLTSKNRTGALRWLRELDADVNKIYSDVEQFGKKAPQPNLLNVFMATSGKGGEVNYLIRGEPERKNGVAPPGFLQVLVKSQNKDEQWTGQVAAKKSPAVEPRIALAKWITDTDQGAGLLLARVIVNRLWQHHMGRGIVATSNDFGVQGEPPTHPELLDYLANELLHNGWKLKPIHKLIMTSAVYLQGGEINPANMKVDPQNHLWWRRPARRLEAEAIRDALLAVSGTLDPTMYGAGTLEANSNRRSVYLKVKRSQMIPLMQIFDVPEAIQSIGERSTTTVPTQSLAFLNSPFVRQRAEKFAQGIRPKTAEGLPQAIDQAYLVALSRLPTTLERESMLTFVQQQVQSYGANARAQELALTDFCQVLLCLNEFIYID